MIRGVLFDIGGVLETTPSTRWQARWEAELGLAPGTIDERLADVYRAGTTGAVTEAEIVATVHRELTDRAEALLGDLWAEYLGEADVRLQRYFAGLRPRYRTGILSNSWVGAREREHARYGYGDQCDVVVYSHEEGMVKPDPRFFELACERLGVAPPEVVFLDDVRGHVEAARALGMTAIHHVGTDESLAALRAVLD